MRIDGGHGGGDHLKAGTRVAILDEHLEITTEAIRRARIAEGGGFAEQEDPVGVFGLFPKERHWRGGPRLFRREKELSEVLVGNDPSALRIGGFEKEGGGMAVAGEAEQGKQDQGKQSK